jgi:hypothetical protein
VRGDRSLATAGAVGLVTGLALLTKAFAVVFPPVVAAAYLLSLREGAPAGWRARAGLLARPVALAGGATVAVAGWWYVGVRARTGTFTPSIEAQRYTSELAPPGFAPDAGAFFEEFTYNIVVRTWGSFGWYSVRVPALFALLLTLVVGAAMVVALRPPRAAGGADRFQRAWLLLPVALLATFVVGRAWDIYATSSRFQFIQGRYLFAGAVGAFVLVAIGVERVVGRWAPVAAAVTAAVAQAVGLRQALADWWGGPGLGSRGQLRAMVAWSGWPGELVAVLLGLTVVAGTWLVAELVRDVRRPQSPDGGEVVSGTT